MGPVLGRGELAFYRGDERPSFTEDLVDDTGLIDDNTELETMAHQRCMSNGQGLVRSFVPAQGRVIVSIEAEAGLRRAIGVLHILVGVVRCSLPLVPVLGEAFLRAAVDMVFFGLRIDVKELPAVMQDVVRGPHRVAQVHLFVRLRFRVPGVANSSALAPVDVRYTAVDLVRGLDAQGHEDLVRTAVGAVVGKGRQRVPLHERAVPGRVRQTEGCDPHIVAGRLQAFDSV